MSHEEATQACEHWVLLRTNAEVKRLVREGGFRRPPDQRAQCSLAKGGPPPSSEGPPRRGDLPYHCGA
eukprot:5444980-Pyramimonas_sp.AAC.1